MFEELYVLISPFNLNFGEKITYIFLGTRFVLVGYFKTDIS